jgi:proline dehydrogenase
MTELATSKTQFNNNRLNFNDTENTFSGISNKELKRKFLIFNKIPKTETKIETYSKIASTFLKFRIPLSKTIIKAVVYKQFCGGESIDECDSAVSNLAKKGVGTILDYSVEGGLTEESFEKATQEIIKTIEKGKGDNSFPFAVFKMTGIGRLSLLEKLSQNKNLTAEEKLELENLKSRVNSICELAHSISKPVLIDAEESWIQDAIDNLAVEMMEKYNRKCPLVFNTIQLYRHDRLEFLKNSHQIAQEKGYFLAVKLVRGAYMDKERQLAEEMNYPSPIQIDKDATDRDYNLALRYCVDNIESIGVCAGSHNEESVRILAELLQEKKLSLNHPHVHFAQLYGMGDNISFSLADNGYNTAKYLPYGTIEQTIPYLTRRLKENKSGIEQMNRQLELIIRELERRKISSAQRYNVFAN